MSLNSVGLRNSSTGSARTLFKSALARQVKTDDLSPDDITIAFVISQSTSGPFYLIYMKCHGPNWFR